MEINIKADKGTIKESKHEVVSTMAFLIGIAEDKLTDSPQLQLFPMLKLDKNARIVRNLCMIRTAILRNFKNINNLMRLEYRSILNMSEYIPSSAMRQLTEDGVNFIKKSSVKLSDHINEINRLLTDRINNCQGLFPTWVNWNYVRDLFIMPNGLTERGSKEASDVYYANRSYYPYGMYINWSPYDAGNILYDDRTFMRVLYEQHNDYFADFNQTFDAGSSIKNNIYDFIDQSDKAVVFVDCENSDPYKFCAALRSLDADALSKISKIILFDDVHTSIAWQILEKYTHIPVEYLLIERLHSNKSLVDLKLVTRACKEHYTDNVDSMILASSDSDYWALIDSLPFANFLVMVEKEKCGVDLKTALSNSNIYYCYLDDFYAGGSEDLKVTAVLSEINRQLRPFSFNINDLLDEALRTTRVKMEPHERSRFFDKHLRKLDLVIDADGNASIDMRLK